MPKKKTTKKPTRFAERKGRCVSLLFNKKADLKRLDAVCEHINMSRNKLILHLIDGFLSGVDPDGVKQLADKMSKAITDQIQLMTKEK